LSECNNVSGFIKHTILIQNRLLHLEVKNLQDR